MSETIRDVYTSYLSNRVVVTPPANNVEFVAASATGGPIETIQAVSDAATAEAIFHSGELVKAIRERVNAGSTNIYAVRLATSDAEFASWSEVDSLKIEAATKGTWANGLKVDIAGTGSERTVEITDPVTDEVYSFTEETVAALVTAINDGQTLVNASSLGSSLPTAGNYTLSSGNDGDSLTPTEYAAGTALSEDYPEVNWLHFIGANTRALWTAILTSCQTMIDDGVGERFAILELPAFSPADNTNPTPTEINNHISTIKGDVDLTKDRNAVFAPAGNGKFVDGDGAEYWNTLGSLMSGTLASLKVSKSLLGEFPTGLVACTPFSRANQASLIASNINYIRFQPGVGYIFALSNNNPPTGDPYNRIEKLRSTYSAGKQVRAALVPHLGKGNDVQGRGLKAMEADCQRPLDLMVQNEEIDSYELELISTDEMREAGQVKVELEVNNLKAFEFIIHNVYAV